MGYLPQFKIGSCSCGCGGKNVQGRKVGKVFMCMQSYNTMKSLEQIDKAKKRNALKLAGTKVRNIAVENPDAKAPKSYEELSQWFKERMDSLPVRCENCKTTNNWLEVHKEEKIGKLKWRSCQAHLLPKRHFRSLQTHPLNGMVLGSGYSGLCHCHDNYDASWEKASKMYIWDEVVRRFKIMYPLITEEEHRFIPPQLLQEINQI